VSVTVREHDIDWLAPAPLWAAGEAGTAAPVVVQFNGDDFMDRLRGMLAGGADGVTDLNAARPTPNKPGDLPVLYQPVNGSYALVCASLTCRLSGRPEKGVAPGRKESVGFVLRRVDNGVESAWVPAGSGAGSWHSPVGAVPFDGEEVIPLFPVPVGGPSARVVWAGVIPTSSRETYLPGEPGDLTPPAIDEDPRILELDSGPGAALTADLGPQVDVGTRRAAGMQAALSLAVAIRDSVLGKSADVEIPSPAGDTADITADLKTTEKENLIKKLQWAGLDKAVDFAWKERAKLLDVTTVALDGQPDFQLPLTTEQWGLIRTAFFDALPQKVPLPARFAAGTALPKLTLDLPGNLPQQYLVRCVYRRAGCPPVVSRPSARFAVASVYDPDAPARTIRIPMPTDMGLRTLRRLKKNVGFVLSRTINAQVQALSGTKLKDLDAGKVNTGGKGIAEICTFALPVITLCAMIVLFIFVVLLNIAFFWLPLLKVCLPVPKGKPS